MSNQNANHVPTSNYLDEECCRKIRDLLELQSSLAFFHMNKLFEIIDKGLEDYVEDMGYDEDAPREMTASEEAMAMGEDRG